jgi:DNA segregation ATPase FtsK/SpoIIIE, S-DNA-T family
VIVLVDEVAFLTASHPSKTVRERVKAHLATLTTQGRAAGYCLVAALQDPRKEVMSIRKPMSTSNLRRLPGAPRLETTVQTTLAALRYAGL